MEREFFKKQKTYQKFEQNYMLTLRLYTCIFPCCCQHCINKLDYFLSTKNPFYYYFKSYFTYFFISVQFASQYEIVSLSVSLNKVLLKLWSVAVIFVHLA